MPVRRKEIRFFDRHFEQGLEWYEAFFCSEAEAASYRAIGEISRRLVGIGAMHQDEAEGLLVGQRQ